MERNIKEIQQCLYTNPEFNAIAQHQPLWSVIYSRKTRSNTREKPSMETKR